MSGTPAEGLFVGSTCFAGPGGAWAPAVIRSVHADGTARVEFEVKETTLMPYWYGVTPMELAFRDREEWAAVFPMVSPGGKPIDLPAFTTALGRLGYAAAEDQVRTFWRDGCAELFGVTVDQADTFALDSAAAYAMFLRLGQCAKSIRAALHPPPEPPLLKLYWNQTRMGGRDPSELAREVTLRDTFAALGVDGDREDAKAAAAVARFEAANAVRLPDTLKRFATRRGIAEAVHDSHPNNPDFVEVGRWELLTGLRSRGADRDLGIVLVTPHQGDHEWVVVFDSGEADARIWLRQSDDTGWALTARSLPHLFWDLAQTGLGWYQDTRFQGGKQVTTSDLGYVPT